MCGFLLNTPSAGLAQAVWPQQGVPDHQQLRAKVKADGPRLLFSDSPEMVYATGILYRDTLQGEGRLFFHHVNGTSKLKKLAILVKNNGLRPASFTVTRSGIDGPSHDYQAVGKNHRNIILLTRNRIPLRWALTKRRNFWAGKARCCRQTSF